jgi:hypothetical protein
MSEVYTRCRINHVVIGGFDRISCICIRTIKDHWKTACLIEVLLTTVKFSPILAVLNDISLFWSIQTGCEPSQPPFGIRSFAVWGKHQWGREADHLSPPSVFVVYNEWSYKYVPHIIARCAQVSLSFASTVTDSVSRIAHKASVKVHLINLRTYLCSYYILCFMYIAKENKFLHDAILSVN